MRGVYHEMGYDDERSRDGNAGADEWKKECCRSVAADAVVAAMLLTRGDLLGSRKTISIQKFDTHSFSNGFAFVLHAQFFFTSISVLWFGFCFELWKNLKFASPFHGTAQNFHFHWKSTYRKQKKAYDEEGEKHTHTHTLNRNKLCWAKSRTEALKVIK